MAQNGLYKHLNEVQYDDELRWQALQEQRQRRPQEPSLLAVPS